MYVAEVGTNVDEMETVLNHALLQATGDPETTVSCVGNTVTIHTSQKQPSEWTARRLRVAVQNAIQGLVPGCEVTWKS
jgi:hypothetical protein